MQERMFSGEVERLIASGEFGGWQEFFLRETEESYFKEMSEELDKRYSEQVIFPKIEDIFSAFVATKPEQCKVVLLGQDPYHEEGQGMGLAFSVREGVKIPPSLRNIFAELNRDLGVVRSSGDISDLAKNGVLLLNTVLTVEEGKAGSHSKLGWKKFTKNALEHLAKSKSGLVFLLLGKPAQAYGAIAEKYSHKVVATSHPSPLSVYRGFDGSGVFGKVNALVGEDVFGSPKQQTK